MPDFEFDPKKSKSNLAKHGIDFAEAQALWTDPDLIEIPAKVVGEPRYMIIGRINKQHWSGVITYWNTCVRIISVRGSSQWEVSIYESIKDAINKG